MSVIFKLKVAFKSRCPKPLWQLLHQTRTNVGAIYQDIKISIRGKIALRALKYSGSKRIRGYFAKHKVRKLQLGAGSNELLTWLNTEGFAPSSFNHSLKVAENYIFLDVRDRFPFEDESIDYIFHEHVIEHLNYQQGRFLLQECFRVLKRGGRMRVATPDFKFYVGLCEDSLDANQELFLKEYIRFNSGIWSSDLLHVQKNHAVFTVNHAFRAWGHEMIYDYHTLAEAIDVAGFVDIARVLPHSSNDPNLCGLESRKEMVGIADALIIEAEKP